MATTGRIQNFEDLANAADRYAITTVDAIVRGLPPRHRRAIGAVWLDERWRDDANLNDVYEIASTEIRRALLHWGLQ